MLKAIVKGTEAAYPWNSFDSILETPSGANPRQNAWLTLQLRVKLNFCDSKTPAPGRTVQRAGRWCARDLDGYLFPLLDWTPELIDKFMRGFAKRAEDTWNFQFLLITPGDYADLDYDADWTASMPLKVRPNVLCLLRLAVIGPSGLLDNSPAAGPLRSGAPHRTINVFNLDKTVSAVDLAPDVTPTANTPSRRNISSFNDGSFRSDDRDYDDSDLFRPRVIDAANKVHHNTIGHEVGHALGQAHIRGLDGDATCALGSATGNDGRCYGADMEGWDIMGGGDRVYLVNAISWKERIALHTGLPSTRWPATGVTATPPRSLPAAIANTSFAPTTW